MLLKNKYVIEKHLITNSVNRSRRKLTNRKFGVAHETANNTANALTHVNYFQNNNVQASYHQLVDSERIIELIPDDEIALHVRRDKDRQTLKLGRANDNAVAISLCRTGSFPQAYDRYVWAWARVCIENEWKPTERITAHYFEDPLRRSDPHSWLEPNGIYWNVFLADVYSYVRSWNSKLTMSNKLLISTTSENILQQGDKGVGVKELQQRLINIGFNLPNFGVDGVFGSETKHVLSQFQKTANIEVDGIFGPQSSKALNNYLSSALTIPPLPNTVYKAKTPYPNELGVKAVQEALVMINYYPDHLALNYGIDGIYGPKTADAVKRFQQEYLPNEVDGKYGPNTRSMLLKQLSRNS